MKGGTPSEPVKELFGALGPAGTHMAQEEVQMFPTTSLTLGREELETPLDDLESVVALYQSRVFRFLLATLRDRDAAETLTQETFLRAWSARSSFREDCSLATWLIRIALNLARDHTRTGRFRFWKRVTASAGRCGGCCVAGSHARLLRRSNT